MTEILRLFSYGTLQPKGLRHVIIEKICGWCTDFKEEPFLLDMTTSNLRFRMWELFPFGNLENKSSYPIILQHRGGCNKIQGHLISMKFKYETLVPSILRQMDNIEGPFYERATFTIPNYWNNSNQGFLYIGSQRFLKHMPSIVKEEFGRYIPAKDGKLEWTIPNAT